MRPIRLASVVLAGVLLAAGLTSAASATASSSCGASGAATTMNGSLPDGATYLIQCPAGHWNGTLLPLQPRICPARIVQSRGGCWRPCSLAATC